MTIFEAQLFAINLKLTSVTWIDERALSEAKRLRCRIQRLLAAPRGRSENADQAKLVRANPRDRAGAVLVAGMLGFI
jgi:hypothetical protein